MGKKFKKTNINETNNVEDVNGRIDTSFVDAGINVRAVKEDKKKNKRKNYEAKVNGGYVKVADDAQKEKDQKKRKRRMLELPKERVDGIGADVGKNGELSKEYEEKRKKKSKKKHEVGGGVLLSSTGSEAVKGNGSDKDNNNFQKDDCEKKKGRKVKHEVSKRSLHMTDVMDSEKDKNLNSERDVKKNEKRKKKKNNNVKERKTNKNYLKRKTTSLDEDARERTSKENCDEDVMEKTELKKRNNFDARLQKVICEGLANEGNITRVQDYADSESNAGLVKGNPQDSKVKNVKAGKKKKSKNIENKSVNSEHEGKQKKVRFSSHVEVFSSGDPNFADVETQEEKLVQGKRFSREEDVIVKEAVFNYIEAHDLGEEGLDKVLHCRSYPELKNCWKEIGSALPHRPYLAIYYRAHILFERDEKRKWTKEEYELLRKHQEVHGNDWKSLADELGKHRFHVKDAWRRIKLRNMKKGHWSQDEYQTLFDLVNTDLQMKASEEKKFKHGMLRDNICWSAISDKLSTRTNSTCCVKWYTQLTSPMVAEGVWADADDYRLLDALFDLDACCIEDVEWDDLIEQRSGDLCRKRWDQMVRHIGHYGNKSFSEQVEILATRYCPDILESREAWDNKPVVP